jgi:HAD superfamily hydrolase (TIGR01509 family)
VEGVLLKAVLFDMDGVLIYSEDEYFRHEKRILEEHGCELTHEAHIHFSGVRTLEMVTEMQQQSGFPGDPAAIADRIGAVMDDYYRSGELIPIKPMTALLKSCAQAGLKTAVATSSQIDQAENVVRRLGLSPYVHAIATSGMAGASKPAPDIFLLAAKMLDAAPEECIVIEDATKGLEAAKAAAMKAIGVRHEGRPIDLSLADRVVDAQDDISVDMLRTLEETR